MGWAWVTEKEATEGLFQPHDYPTPDSSVVAHLFGACFGPLPGDFDNGGVGEMTMRVRGQTWTIERVEDGVVYVRDNANTRFAWVRI